MALPYPGHLSRYGSFPVLYDGKGLPRFAHWSYPRKVPPSGIVLHFTRGSTFDANAIYLTKPNPRKVSAHLLVGRAGETALLCPFTRIAYHANKWSANRRTVGIEVVNDGVQPFTEPQLVALAGLCGQLCELFYIPVHEIVGHRDIVDTDCPGELDVGGVRQRVIQLLERG